MTKSLSYNHLLLLGLFSLFSTIFAFGSSIEEFDNNENLENYDFHTPNENFEIRTNRPFRFPRIGRSIKYNNNLEEKISHKPSYNEGSLGQTISSKPSFGQDTLHEYIVSKPSQNQHHHQQHEPNQSQQFLQDRKITYAREVLK